MTLSCLYLRVTASQSLSVSSLILTCSGKLWPIVAAAAGAGTLGAIAASFVVLRMRNRAYDVILRIFRIPSPPPPQNLGACVSGPDSFSPRGGAWPRETMLERELTAPGIIDNSRRGQFPRTRIGIVRKTRAVCARVFHFSAFNPISMQIIIFIYLRITWTYFYTIYNIYFYSFSLLVIWVHGLRPSTTFVEPTHWVVP